MNRNLEYILDKYKFFKVERKNKVYIIGDDSNRLVFKDNIKIDYQKLYNYLYSRSFNYLPKLVFNENDIIVLEYKDDISIDNNQKGIDLIKLVSLLHNKTSYFKKVTNDLYKEIYDNLLNNIYYLSNRYDKYYKEFIDNIYYSPSRYLFLRNYSLIYNAINYCKIKIDEWFNSITDKNRERVCVIHNNLSLEHCIINDSNYLISWDKYMIDTPVLDLYHFYLNDWDKLSFKEIFKTYMDDFNLLDDEKTLLYLLISLPYDIEFSNNEYNNTVMVRRLIDYLNSSSLIIGD